jgi:hypothetical protein
VAGVKAIVRTLLPPVIVVAGVAPLLGGRHPGRGVSPLVGVAALVPWVVILVAAVGVWVRKKQAMMAWWRNAMEEASAARRPPPAAPAGRSRSGRE